MPSVQKTGKGNTPRPWVIYTRVSTDDQAQTGTSLETQEAGCRSLAKAYGHPIAEVICDDGYSAATLKGGRRKGLEALNKRPGAKRLLAMIEAGSIGGVIIHKLNRLVRNARQLLELIELMEERGVAFASVNDRIDTGSAMGRMFLTLLAAIDQLESEQISERVVAVLQYMRSQGRWAGGNVPAGMMVEVRGKDRYLVPDPTWGPIVGKAWPMVIAGASLRKVADWFTTQEVPLKSGKRWSMPAVSRVLSRRLYIGALVDQETFDRAQAALASRISPEKRKREADEAGETEERTKAVLVSGRVWRLQDIARCARCGSAMIGVTARGHGGEYAYLRCLGKVRRGREHCGGRDLPAQPWEDAVVERLVQYVTGSNDLADRIAAIVAQHQAEAAPLRATRDAASLERDRLREQLGKAMDMILAGGSVARAFAPKVQELQDAIEALDRRIATADGRLMAAELQADHVAAIAEALREEITHLPEQPLEVQKRNLAQVVEHVELASGMPGRIVLVLPDLLGEPPPIPGHQGSEAAAAAGGAQVRSKLAKWLPGEDSNLRPID